MNGRIGALARCGVGVAPLPGGSCRPLQQAQEQVPSGGVGRKLAHVADALGGG